MPLSGKQMEYLALAWQCFETEPKIDYEKFKTVAGLASSASARELMRVTKNKLKGEYGALGASVAGANAKTSPIKKTVGASAATPKSGNKRGKFVDDMDQTPAKKAKTTNLAKKRVAGEENDHIKAETVSEAESEDHDEHTLF